MVKEVKQNAELFAVLHVDKQVTTSGKGTNISEFLKVAMNEYRDVFPEELPNQLPPERNVDHEIPLQEGAIPPFGPIYRLSFHELKKLKSFCM